METAAITHYHIYARIHVQTGYTLGNELWNLEIAPGISIATKPAQSPSWEGGKHYEIELTSFSSRDAAEVAQNRLETSLLWLAISIDHPLRILETRIDEVAGGASFLAMTCHLEGITNVFPPDKLQEEFKDAYHTETLCPNDNVALSMALFSVARMNANSQARFVSLISAIEPLAKQQVYNSTDVRGIADEFSKRMLGATCTTQEDRVSLAGRASDLKKESISLAIRKFVRNTLGESYVKAAKEAYSLRGKIIHDGKAGASVNIEEECGKVSALMRLIYSKLLDRKLLVGTDILTPSSPGNMV